MNYRSAVFPLLLIPILSTTTFISTLTLPSAYAEESVNPEGADKGGSEEKGAKDADEKVTKKSISAQEERSKEDTSGEVVEVIDDEGGEDALEISEIEIGDVDIADGGGDVETAGSDPEPIKTFYITTKLISPERLSRTGGAAHRFNEEEIKKFEYDDPTSILQKVPGVIARTEDGFGLRPNIGIRGVTADRSKKLTLMVDDILFGPAPYSAPAAYFFPIMSRMVGIEVFKGPAAIMYGPNTLAGSINWRSREIPYGLAGGFDVNYGTFVNYGKLGKKGFLNGGGPIPGGGKLHGWVGWSNDHGGLLAEVVGWRSNGFKTLPLVGPNKESKPTGFDKIDTMFKGRINTSPDAEEYHALELKLGLALEDSHETYAGISIPDFAGIPLNQAAGAPSALVGEKWASPYERYLISQNDEMKWWRTQVELTHTMELGADIKLITKLYRHDFSRVWNKFNTFRNGKDGSPYTINDILGKFTQGTLGEKCREAIQSGDGAAAEDACSKAYRSFNLGEKYYYDITHGVLGNVPTNINQEGNLVFGRNERRYYSQGIQSNLEWDWKHKEFSNRLTLGFRFHSDGIRRNHGANYWTVGKDNSISLIKEQQDCIDEKMAKGLSRSDAEGICFRLDTYNEDQSMAISLYAEDQFDWNMLSVTPGIRIEYIHDRHTQLPIAKKQLPLPDNPSKKDNRKAIPWSSKERSYLEVIPGIGAYYEFYKPFGFLAGVHKGFSPLGPDSIPDNPQEGKEQHAEISWNYEAGFRYFDSKTFNTAEVIGFFSDYQNLGGSCTQSRGCGLVGSGTIDSVESLGKAWVYGVEAGFNFQFNLPWDLTLPVSGAYTFTQAILRETPKGKGGGEIKIPGLADACEGDHLPYIPEHTASATIGLRHLYGAFSVTANYVGSQRDAAWGAKCTKGLNAREIPPATDPYVIVDANISANVWGPITVYGKFNNLLNSQPIAAYEPLGIRTVAPFAFSFGVRGEFGSGSN